MEADKCSTSVESVEITKPTAEITNIISNEYIKIFELNECCRVFESEVANWKRKVETLVSAKNESLKLKAEYKHRSKINVANSESLLQAVNELHGYKCELKSVYIAREKEFKLKKMRYEKVLSDYESAWKNNLKQYNENPTVVQLQNTQKENNELEKEVEKLKELLSCTKTDFIQLKKNITQKFLDKVVEFSETIVYYKNSSASNNTGNKCFNFQKPHKNLKHKLFEARNVSLNSLLISPSQDVNFSVDVSMFDDVIVPSENLESQSLEEDYSFLQSDEVLSSASKEQSRSSEGINDSQMETEAKSNNEPLKTLKENFQSNAENGSESQYFWQRHYQDIQKQSKTTKIVVKQVKEDLFENTKKTKLESNGLSIVQEQLLSENDPKTAQMQFEETYSDTSRHSKDNCENRDQNSLSVSFEDLPRAEKNDTGESRKLLEQESNIKAPPKPETKKNDFQSFSTFFSVGNEQESSKPSIFKLF